jgi:3-dehydroquinate synthase
MHTVLNVDSGTGMYPLFLGDSAVEALTSSLETLQMQGRRFAWVTDDQIAQVHGAFFRRLFEEAPCCVLPAGEQTKSLASVETVCRLCATHGLDRMSQLIAVGGGVIGDLVGYTAASYLRGIDFVQVPTTLLAMVDSSVGGKTGVNLPEGKNLVGAFHQPKAVYMIPECLKTLPQREFASGMAEVIKGGLLGDKFLFMDLVTEPCLSATDPKIFEIIRRACELKARIVHEDPCEEAHASGRALLNLGHTFGHAIEAVAGYSTYLHGEAVAIGTCLAARLSQEIGNIAPDAVTQIRELFERYGLPTTLRSPLSIDALMDSMMRDKKNRSGVLRLVILEAIGQASTIEWTDTDLIRRLWKEVISIEDTTRA